MNPYYYSPAGAEKTLNKLLHGTRQHVILAKFFEFYRIYRVHLDGKSVIVKEINLSHVTNWNKRQVQEEVRGADSVGKLADAFFDGERYFILTEDMGLSWDTVEHGVGDAAQRIRDEADTRYKENAHMKRVYVCRIYLGLSMISHLAYPMGFHWTTVIMPGLMRAIGELSRLVNGDSGSLQSKPPRSERISIIVG
ncbi:hypothetical protein APHAL10511_000008 [Amanita phalloides]|nr:hypothetical protein APHAL10511_000008 [Amanita phalloides]